MNKEGPGSDSRHDEALSIRWATKADLKDITWVIEHGFPDDPGCTYKFPQRKEFPKDFRKWTKLEYEEYLDQHNKFATLVVTAPVLSDTGAVVDRPISIGVWDVAPETKPTGGDRGIDERRDANPQHMRVYAAAAARGFKDHFAKYGNNQLNLWMLVTHPDYRCRGAATMLCNWGQKESMKTGRILTVMASPMGKELYEELGYGVVGSVTAQVEGEEEKVEIDILEKRN
ncbi:gnat family [Fusarium albosuccineum]|uniref:Gnat family n=1 Tax=Fusarium albosuccineum TaxID=1237068 RepID=A0A8H4PLE4_9HYPO|nr:gnat family [Fusarium albosuccineum]